jgi:transposase InsO family protein
MDWFSRYVLAWELSSTLETAFCVAALEAALRRGRPRIFNSDQGSQFTSQMFLAPLIERDIAISMDGRGRALDNVFIERLWRSVKYELIYPGDFADGRRARSLLPLLQSPTPASGARLSNAGCCVCVGPTQKERSSLTWWTLSPNPPGIYRLPPVWRWQTFCLLFEPAGVQYFCLCRRIDI